MKLLIYILSIIIILLIILMVSLIKKINYISKTVDEVVQGNFNQRIRFQNHIKPLNTLCIKINSLIMKMQKIFKRNKVNEDSIKKMISNISHDLRTPLTSMLGYIELVLNDNTLSEEEKRKYIEIVYNKGNHLYSLMEEFFQVSKLESKDVKLDIRKVNISEIIRQNIISFFNELKKRDMEPQINIPEEDIYAFGNEKAVNRILSNLINNSLKYGSEGTTIGVNLTYDKNNVFISVWDNGVGIPKEEIDYVFDRLYTVEKSRKLNLKSSGLGLTIVKKLVEALGGTISVSSIPFEKTAFTFTLPKKQK
ncbi:histidine kinase [Clostridium carboxidivorans P7]|uniref:sensor histidine kinase n=1 Tax=Clostridium carboxidivorans TaxID=217159 RepID=UPI0001D393F9|nr:HAMP domain-containing sensor histidine kinase [Clostridium carboxidivorans]AKN31003.1 histidine kinase [Clostridium carboxidivorans P7]EFG88738.1 ATPase, histidine kinase-, DNA gyrase B-, and HSP90-like domain protein [Clostridium carboxidivorans P7]